MVNSLQMLIIWLWWVGRVTSWPYDKLIISRYQDCSREWKVCTGNERSEEQMFHGPLISWNCSFLGTFITVELFFPWNFPNEGKYQGSSFTLWSADQRGSAVGMAALSWIYSAIMSICMVEHCYWISIAVPPGPKNILLSFGLRICVKQQFQHL